ncbi:MAG: peptidase U32 family protein [Microcoleaceae cyanobacterium]
MWKPELLAPAKNLERLKVAITYGADAVYIGGQKYGLRARADNFTADDLEQAVTFAHAHNAKVYVTLNAFPHDEDLEGLEQYCQFLDGIGVDAVIVSDLGMIRMIQRSSNLNIHLSTQASCLNSYAGQLWKKLGVQRLIVGREVSIAESGLICKTADIEVEMFTHGAMCMAYSGHCTISNFTAGRDSNRGGCIQSCRFPYQIESKSEHSQTPVTFMSSKDLWGVNQIEAFFQHRICSLKIEGRMKSAFYVATTCRAYRQLIDAYANHQLTPSLRNQIAAELESVPHRDYSTGSLEQAAGSDSVYQQFHSNNTGTHEYLGLVMAVTADKIILQLFEPLKLGDTIEIIPVQGEPIHWVVNQLFSIVGDSITSMRKDSIVCLPKSPETIPLNQVQKLNVIRIVKTPAAIKA